MSISLSLSDSLCLSNPLTFIYEKVMYLIEILCLVILQRINFKTTLNTSIVFFSTLYFLCFKLYVTSITSYIIYDVL